MEEYRRNQNYKRRRRRAARKSSSGRSNSGNSFLNFLSDNSRLVIIVLAVIILIVIVLILQAVLGRRSSDSEEPETVDEVLEEVVEETAPELEKDAVPEVNELVNSYFEAMKTYDVELYTILVTGDSMTEEKLEKKGEFIDDYQNISCYTLPGLTDGTYVAYVYYEILFHNVDIPCPSLIWLYICTNDYGQLYIDAGSLDSATEDYINSTWVNEQVMALIEETDNKMQEAINEDETLGMFVDMLQEGASYTEGETETATGAGSEEMVFEERDETVITTDVVRIRSTPETGGDNVLQTVELGTELHRTGYNESWSRIKLNDGTEAYVSSEYVITK